MVPNKGETVVCGCHCPHNMAVCVHEVQAWLLVSVCVPLALSLHYFNAIELSSIYFSSTVFHDIFKQIQQHVHICKIFARWHLAIAIIRNIITVEKRVAFQLLNSIDFNLLAISSHLLLQKSTKPMFYNSPYLQRKLHPSNTSIFPSKPNHRMPRLNLACNRQL